MTQWHHYYTEPKGMTLFWMRVGTICGIIGAVCLAAAVIGGSLGALIYHALH